MEPSDASPARGILILGAYGLIGSGLTTHLLAQGYPVTGLGRTASTARRVHPDIPWIIQDVSALCDVAAWEPILTGVRCVVNASGALQDGPGDDLEAIHHHAVSAMAAACAAAGVQVIQISAVGALKTASTAFLSSKARGDDAIRLSGAVFQIFRPGLVLAPHAYGGTMMLRMLAAVPVVQPIAVPEARIQTVGLADLAEAVRAAIDGRLPNGFEADLVEPEAQPLRTVVAAMRHWLGFPKAWGEVLVPRFGVSFVCWLADGLGRLGWRSPLRTTAFNVLADGVEGTHTSLSAYDLAPLSTLPETLRQTPARAEDRLFARMAFLMPLIIVVLCLFWLASGVIGLLRAQEAAMVLEQVGWSHGLALASVIFWAFVDIAIGVGFALRRYAGLACWAAVGVSLFYLAASTVTVPGLWLDPLGPLVKVVPGIVLALVARIGLETR